ncbi:hypothetical protein GOODEAATRI_008938 [Goodea atripinnis]|uniref:Secreted protein n=1 Tax=Goodea atripinnis TaxID=208336 RepID=A0ABV0PM22_9TELE
MPCVVSLQFLSGLCWTGSFCHCVPGCRLLTGLVPSPHPSTPRQLLSVEAGSGAKSEAKESSGCSGAGTAAVMCRKGLASSGDGPRITPALVLLGIHLVKKSAGEY